MCLRNNTQGFCMNSALIYTYIPAHFYIQFYTQRGKTEKDREIFVYKFKFCSQKNMNVNNCMILNHII